jgi:hypothetical protein
MNTPNPLVGTPISVQQLERMEFGTLPETIGETDLKKLNAVLVSLFERLRVARAQFENETDHGRQAAFTALGAVWKFVALFDAPYRESLQIPLVRLQDALVMLDQNRVELILTPTPRSGRAPSSHAYAALKGHAAATVQRLLKAGAERRDAYRLVAKELTRLGMRPERGSGDITATTVRHWCDEVSAEIDRSGTAAVMYDTMLAPSELHTFMTSAKDPRGFALKSLGDWISRHFPDRKKKPT